MDPSMLPNERKISIKHFIYLINHIAPAVVSIFLVLGFHIIVLATSLELTQYEITSMIVMGSIFALISLAGEIFLLKPGINYIIGVKKGTRLFADIVHISPQKSVSLKGKILNTDHEQVVYPSSKNVELCQGYTKIPVFFYKNNFYIDWHNVENYGVKIESNNESKKLYASKLDRDVAELASKAARDTHEQKHVVVETIYRNYYRAMLIPFIFSIVASILFFIPLTISSIIELIHLPSFEVKYFGLIFFDCLAGTFLYYTIPSVLNYPKYKNGVKKGERVVAYSRTYTSAGAYKAMTGRKVDYPNELTTQETILELTYVNNQGIEIINSYSFSKDLFPYDIELFTCLPAFYYKKSIIPDWEGISIRCTLNNYTE